MSAILGKWQQPAGQPFPGLWFEFRADGTFEAQLEEMGIVSGGTYHVDGDGIDIDQTRHTLGLLGKFAGRWAVEGDTLRMAMGDPNGPRPADLAKARTYLKI
jgi:hypothetical protein